MIGSRNTVGLGRLRTAARTREFWSLLIGVVVILVLWDAPVLQPLKWLTVLFHELSHALVGGLTGGRVVSLNITHRESGICHVAGGNRTLILLAGYPGSLCWGLGALVLARHARWVKPALYIAGAMLMVASLLYVRPVIGFGFPFCLAAALGLLCWARFGGAGWQAWSLRFLGVSSCVYVVMDIQQDVFGGHGGVSDATLLAQHTWIPAWVWGAFWYLLSLILVYVTLLSPSGRGQSP